MKSDPSKYKYEYPEHTTAMLAEWATLVPPPVLCHHSRHNVHCSACVHHATWASRLNEAKEVLGV